jgi:hypothetical protein
VQGKGIDNIVNKIIAKIFPKFEKVMLIPVQETPGHQTDMTKIELLHSIL